MVRKDLSDMVDESVGIGNKLVSDLVVGFGGIFREDQPTSIRSRSQLVCAFLISTRFSTLPWTIFGKSVGPKSTKSHGEPL